MQVRAVHHPGPHSSFLARSVILRRLRRPEPTLRPDRWLLSVCYPQAEFRGAWCDVPGKTIEVQRKMMFREQ